MATRKSAAVDEELAKRTLISAWARAIESSNEIGAAAAVHARIVRTIVDIHVARRARVSRRANTIKSTRIINAASRRRTFVGVEALVDVKMTKMPRPSVSTETGIQLPDADPAVLTGIRFAQRHGNLATIPGVSFGAIAGERSRDRTTRGIRRARIRLAEIDFDVAVLASVRIRTRARISGADVVARAAVCTRIRFADENELRLAVLTGVSHRTRASISVDLVHARAVVRAR